MEREKDEDEGVSSPRPFPIYKKDKRGEKASFICFFAPFAFINFFLDNLLKFIVNLQPVIKINKPKR